MGKRVFSWVLVVLFGCSVWSSSHALLITTAGGDKFDITTVTGRLDGPTSIRSDLELLPWFGDEALAEELVGLVQDDLGLPNSGFTGPNFLYSTSSTFWSAKTWDFSVVGVGNVLSNSDRTWATLVAVPEPTTLALMTLGVAGIGYSRKRKAA